MSVHGVEGGTRAAGEGAQGPQVPLSGAAGCRRNRQEPGLQLG